MITLRHLIDISTLMKWRIEVIENVFGCKPDKQLIETNRSYYERNIDNGCHYAYIVETEGNEAGCGAICISEELPSPDNPTGRCAYLMNIYVRKEYRNHGLAHHIVSKLIEQARILDCGKIYLETTDLGRPVYASMGFRDMPDMMKLSVKKIHF